MENDDKNGVLNMMETLSLLGKIRVTPELIERNSKCSIEKNGTVLFYY